MHEGRADFEQGRIYGHQNPGVVQEVDPAVERLTPGDRVCLPFNVSCGHCKNCERGLTAFCLRANQKGAWSIWTILLAEKAG
jgi:threonine dehydrogenase-like Zn-dependent dehydrogenase